MKYTLAFTAAAFLHAQLANGQDPLCRTGILGEFGLLAACCLASCGECGAPGCSRRPGGAACCGTGISRMEDNNCDTSDPPCVVQRDPFCETGLPNFAEGICCARACGRDGGRCGGTFGDGCEQRFAVPSSELTDTRCCSEPILAEGRPCADFPPPCVLGNAPAPVPAPPAPAPACNGILSEDGNSCCPTGCGGCGGAGCGRLPLGNQNCCTSRIQASGRSCSEFGAPCIV